MIGKYLSLVWWKCGLARFAKPVRIVWLSGRSQSNALICGDSHCINFMPQYGPNPFCKQFIRPKTIAYILCKSFSNNHRGISFV